MLTRPRIRQLGLGELLDESFRLYRNNFLTFTTITALIIVPYFLLNLVVQYPMQDRLADLQAQTNQGYTPTTVDEVLQLYTDLLFWYIGIFGLGLVYSVIFQPLLEGALVHAVSRRYLGAETSVGESFGAALRRSPALIGARLIPALIGIGVSLGVFALFALMGYQAIRQSASGTFDSTGVIIVLLLGLLGFAVLGIMMLVGIALMVRIFFTAEAAMVEHTGPWESIVRSWRLTQGYFWRTLGYWIIIGLLTYFLMLIPGLVISTPMSVFQVDMRIQLVISTCVGAVFGVIVMPFNLLAYTLMYYDLRIRKEGFDLEQHANTLLSPGIAMSTLESR